MALPQHPSTRGVHQRFVAAFACAATASGFLWFGPVALWGERIDLESVLPLIGDSVTGPGTARSGAAGLVLLSVALIAGLPLLRRGPAQRAVGIGAAIAVTPFAIGTLTRNGIFYLPAAALLWFATGRLVPVRRRPSPAPSRGAG